MTPIEQLITTWRKEAANFTRPAEVCATSARHADELAAALAETGEQGMDGVKQSGVCPHCGLPDCYAKSLPKGCKLDLSSDIRPAPSPSGEAGSTEDQS